MGFEPPWRALVGQNDILQPILQLTSHKIGMWFQRCVKIYLIHLLKRLRRRISCCVNG